MQGDWAKLQCGGGRLDRPGQIVFENEEPATQNVHPRKCPGSCPRLVRGTHVGVFLTGAHLHAWLDGGWAVAWFWGGGLGPFRLPCPIVPTSSGGAPTNGLSGEAIKCQAALNHQDKNCENVRNITVQRPAVFGNDEHKNMLALTTQGARQWLRSSSPNHRQHFSNVFVLVLSMAIQLVAKSVKIKTNASKLSPNRRRTGSRATGIPRQPQGPLETPRIPWAGLETLGPLREHWALWGRVGKHSPWRAIRFLRVFFEGGVTGR